MRERKNYTEQRLRKENHEFRDNLRPKVFPCIGDELEVQESDSVYYAADQRSVAPSEAMASSPEVVRDRRFSVLGNSYAQSAEFPGGVKAMRSYISETIRFPETARFRYISGTCSVSFNILEDGSLANFAVVRQVPNCPECDEEALRVIRSMPPWKPAEKNGIPKTDVYTIPILFKVNGKAEMDEISL